MSKLCNCKEREAALFLVTRYHIRRWTIIAFHFQQASNDLAANRTLKSAPRLPPNGYHNLCTMLGTFAALLSTLFDGMSEFCVAVFECTRCSFNQGWSASKDVSTVYPRNKLLGWWSKRGVHSLTPSCIRMASSLGLVAEPLNGRFVSLADNQ
jgi:hypothetical protein